MHFNQRPRGPGATTARSPPPLLRRAGAELAAQGSGGGYLWAVLIARIYEVFPLLCTL